MARYRIHRTPLMSLLLFILVVSCASPISQRYRHEAAPGLTFPMVFENPSKYKGQTVIWGGTVIRSVNYKEGSELFILELPLGARDRPEAGENAAAGLSPRARAISTL
ncbi:MAG: Slp family lipoprotein [Acidobacteriota bacterium]